MPIEPQKPVPVPDQPPPVEIKHAAPRVDKSLNKHHIGWQVALLAGVIVILSLIFVVIAIQIFPLKKDNFPIVTFTSTPSLTNTLETTDTPVYTLTPTPLPIPTATPIPLSDLQLEPLLIQPGDLPAGYQGAQVRDTAPQMFTGIPTAESIIFVQFEKSGDAAGFVVVFLYDDKTNIDRAYQFTVDSLGDSANSVEVGEKAMMVTFSDIVAGVHMELADLTFFRCNAVILIRMTKDINRDSIVAYAKRLDSRLKPVVCR
jgi:hypothetical protein